MNIRIVAVDNGVGLRRDADHLQALFQHLGCQVTRHDFRQQPPKDEVDIQVHLEHLHGKVLALAKHNVWVPNPEWASPAMVGLAERTPGLRVWAKTDQAAACFGGLPGCRRVGWTTRRIDEHGPPTAPRFLHLAGKSAMKGTQAVIDAAARVPEAEVHIYTRTKHASRSPNCHVHVGWLTDDQVDQLQATSMFHLCPSTAEGYGHYLHEGMAHRAVVITTNAAPMNEQQNTIKLPATTGGQHNLVHRAVVEQDALVQAMQELRTRTPAELQGLQYAARQEWRRRRDEHITAIKHELEQCQAGRW